MLNVVCVCACACACACVCRVCVYSQIKALQCNTNCNTSLS